jgi:hypothetical protein
MAIGVEHAERLHEVSVRVARLRGECGHCVELVVGGLTWPRRRSTASSSRRGICSGSDGGDVAVGVGSTPAGSAGVSFVEAWWAIDFWVLCLRYVVSRRSCLGLLERLCFDFIYLLQAGAGTVSFLGTVGDWKRTEGCPTSRATNVNI